MNGYKILRNTGIWIRLQGVLGACDAGNMLRLIEKYFSCGDLSSSRSVGRKFGREFKVCSARDAGNKLKLMEI